MIKEIATSNYFGVFISLLAYILAVYINKKLKTPIANPLLISIFFVIVILKLFNIPLKSYNNGGSFISMFLAPATALLAYSIYNQLILLRKYLIPILAGCFVGAITSIVSVFILCKLFKVDAALLASLIPKSVTTPIAIEISSSLGGITSVTVASVVITGILGAIMAPIFIKILRLKNKIAIGVALGSSSHAIGTTKALELGEVEGAMSGLAIGISGLITVILAFFI